LIFFDLVNDLPMKRQFKLALMLMFFGLITLSCGGGDGGGGGGGGGGTPTPTPAEARIALLASTNSKVWKASSITLDGAPAPGYPTPGNFKITFRTNKTYSTETGSPVFQTSGQWDFRLNNLEQLIFDNNTNVIADLSGVSATTLTMTIQFALSGSSGSDTGFGTEGVNGRYVFTLIPN
jgi:hypothetical protein